MSSLFNADIAVRLRDEYPRSSVLWKDRDFVANSDRPIRDNRFIGASNIVSISGSDAITLEAPCCAVAQVVNLIARNAISLGMAGQETQPFPVRFYATRQLSIMTKHLSIGDLKMLVEPKYGFVSCEKLTLLEPTEADRDYFEIVKSWAINDKMDIEVLKRLNPERCYTETT
jgi:hypothetical protein